MRTKNKNNFLRIVFLRQEDLCQSKKQLLLPYRVNDTFYLKLKKSVSKGYKALRSIRYISHVSEHVRISKTNFQEQNFESGTMGVV